MKVVYSVLFFIMVHWRNSYHRLVLCLSIVFSELHCSSHVFQMVLINTPCSQVWPKFSLLLLTQTVTFSQVYIGEKTNFLMDFLPVWYSTQSSSFQPALSLQPENHLISLCSKLVIEYQNERIFFWLILVLFIMA